MSKRKIQWLSAILCLAASTAYGCHHGPDIPHAIGSESDEYCEKCHTSAGRAGAPASPHGAGKSGCVECHDVTARATYPAPMPHKAGSEDTCASCHQNGTSGAPVSRHIGEADCLTCHKN